MEHGCGLRDHFGEAVKGYFDTPSMAAPTVATADAMRTAIDDWLNGAVHFETWERVVGNCRQSWAKLSGTDERLVGTCASIVPAVAAVSQAVARRDGVLLVHEREFQSLALPAVAAFGLRRVRTVSGAYDSETFIEALHHDVCTVIVSSVSSATGERPDLLRIVDAADKVGAAVIVDSTQSEGILPLGVPAQRVHAVLAAGYKGLLGPRGTAFAYVREDIDLVPLAVPSPYGMVESRMRGSYGIQGTPFSGGKGVSQSPAWLAWVGAQPGLDLLRSVSPEYREAHALGMATLLRLRLKEAGIHFERSELPSHITTIPFKHAAKVCEMLARTGIRSSARQGRLRLGTHIYTDETDVMEAAQEMQSIYRQLEKGK